MKIALLSCTSSKQDYPCKAAEMYMPSARFKLAYQYAKESCDEIYILSAKYGLLSENDVIEPYNETLKSKSIHERKLWSNNVLQQLENKVSLKNDSFVILAGTAYNMYLLPYIKNKTMPLKGHRMGQWIPKLNQLIANKRTNYDGTACEFLHVLFNDMPRLTWQDINGLQFNNGIYVVFEKGEKFNGKDRIVRIGTHDSEGRLKNRLKDHFVRANKDGSVFRKNIGLALLNKYQNEFIHIWAQNWSDREIRTQNETPETVASLIDTERRVSTYLRENIQFVCFEVPERVDRLKIEAALISTLNLSADFHSSGQWLGLFSPKKEIVTSGLWNSQGLNGIPYSLQEVKALSEWIMTSKANNGRTTTSQSVIDSKISSIKLSNLLNEQMEVTNHNPDEKVSIGTIRQYIQSLISKSSEEGLEYIDLVSGKIHKQMNLHNKMPSVCSAMYQLMTANDVVIKTTPSGKSSTITIRYFI